MSFAQRRWTRGPRSLAQRGQVDCGPSGESQYDVFPSEGGGDVGGSHPFYENNPLSFREEYVRRRSICENEGGAGDGVGTSRTIGGGDQSTCLGMSTIATEEYDAIEEIARLYLICETAQHRGEAPAESHLSANGEDQADQAWESIREWLTAHPSTQERQVAATYQGHHNTAAIHLVCKFVDPPLDIVEALIACDPETVRWPDANGWLPLHHACANNASAQVLRCLVSAFPAGKTAQDTRDRTPLHFVFFRTDAATEEGAEDKGEDSGDDDAFVGSSSPARTGVDSMADIVKLLRDTGAASLPDENGMLPMHYACAYGTSTAVLRALEAAYPESIIVRDKRGRTPLHLAMVNAHRSASPSVLRFLIRNGTKLGIVDIPDNEGRLPLFILASACRNRVLSESERTNAARCLTLYLDAGPRASAEFLNAMQVLPEWLRDDAVINTHVQSVLNAKIVQRWPTAIMLLDGYALLTLVVCFAITSREYIKYLSTNDDMPPQPLPQPLTNLCVGLQILCSTYLLLHEVTQVLAMINLGSFSSWLYDKDNCLDVTVIGLTIFNSILMRADPPYMGILNTDEDPHLRILLASTQVVMWIALLFYIKSVRIGFAVFMGGVAYVTRNLVYFGLCLLVFIVAFAMMFQIIYMGSEVCLQPDKYQNGACYTDFPHCNFSTSLLKVYTMMMGEIGEECRYLYAEDLLSTNGTVENMKDASEVGSLVYALYAFIIVIILSNVLIAIVVDSYSVIKNERSAMVFWSNRLNFVAEMDAIGNFVRTLQRIFLCSGKKKDGAGAAGAPRAVHEVPGGAVITIGSEADGGVFGRESEEKVPMRDVWDAVVSLFHPDLFKEMDVHPGMIEFWFYVMLILFAAFFAVPLWLLAGWLSAGIFWPPQVRKFLFYAKQSSSATRKDVAKQMQQEADQLKKGLVRMKGDFKRDIGDGHTELLLHKAELESVQKALASDLAQVKDIMASLRESAKERVKEREERAIATEQTG